MQGRISRSCSSRKCPIRQSLWFAWSASRHSDTELLLTQVSNRSAGKPIWNLFREKGGIREDDFPACTARISPISAAMMLFGSGQIKIFVKFALVGPLQSPFQPACLNSLSRL